MVVDCTDNFASKFLVNDAAVRAGVPAVLASVYQYEGQLQVVRPDRGGSCLRCQWPEATRDGLVGNCEQAGVLGPVPAVLGQLQAMEVLKIILGLPGQLQDELLLVDLLACGQRRLAAPRNPGVPGRLRAHRRRRPGQCAPDDLDVELPLAAAAAAGYRVVDIREPMECKFEPLPLSGQQSLPLGRLLDGGLRVEPGSRYLLVCAHGVRSRAAAEFLRARGHANVWSLRGGSPRRRVTSGAFPARAEIAAGLRSFAPPNSLTRGSRRPVRARGRCRGRSRFSRAGTRASECGRRAERARVPARLKSELIRRNFHERAGTRAHRVEVRLGARQDALEVEARGGELGTVEGGFGRS